MHLSFMQTKYRLSIIGIILLGIITFSFTPSGLYVAQAQGTLPFSENFSAFTGTGFDTTPAAGQLDSDTWRVTGFSDGSMTFGSTNTTGDFARGTSAVAVTTGGVYAFNVGAGNIILGIQPGGGDFNVNGTITLRIQNTTGSPITDLNVGYDIFYRNDQPRANSLNFRYSSDDTTYTAVGALDFTTPLAGDALGWQSVARSTTITGLNIPNGSFVYLQWIGNDAGGTGSRDEYGIDNVSVTLGTPVDTPPTVTSTTPANGATGVLVNSTITVNFSEAVDISAGGVNIECPSGNAITFSGLPATNTNSLVLAPTVSLPYNTLCSVTVLAVNVVDRDGTADNMASNYNFSFTTEAAPTITRIHDIQGNGSASPIIGSTVTIEAVVIGDYQGPAATELRGFFIQEEDADVDADPMTSEGIFVFCSACPDAVNVGDIVRVTGTVSEFFDMTQITAATAGSVVVQSVGNLLPTPVTINLPVVGNINDFYEPFEGMLVTFIDTLAVSEYFELARYGQIVLYEGGRPYQFTHTNTPSVAGYTTHLDNLARRRIILDDLNNTQNAPLGTTEVIYYPQPGGLSTTNYFRGGDTISNLTGILHWSFAGLTGTDAWRIRPIPNYPITFTPVNARPSAPIVTGDITVASYNVLNYFTTIDTTASNNVGTCGPTGTMDCRGADSNAELTRQTDKLVTALQGLDADIFGLIEIQNTSDSSTVAAVVTALNAVVGAGTYDYVNTGWMGTDAITNAFIYKTAVVQPITVYVDTDLINNRPTLAVLFEVIDPLNPSIGQQFHVVVNHFKSKGSSAGLPGDTDQGDGQAQSNATRVAQANRLISWVNSTLVPNDPDVLVIGDLNSYKQEDPITTLEGAGYTDLVELFGGANAYSYLFDGQLGYLDHALANASLLPYVTGATEWHINADEVPLFDYNDTIADTGEAAFERKPNANPLYQVNPYRTSDHDPVLVGLTFPPAPAPIVTNAIEIVGSGSVASTNPATPAIINNPVTTLQVTFSIPVQNGNPADPDHADNPANYILLAEGSVAGFQTTGANACVTGVDAGDTAITFTVAYNAGTNTATLTITGASPFPPLTVGKYSLIVCGSTSIVSSVGNIPLNNGTDVQYFFDIADNTVIPPVDPVNPTNPDTSGTGTTLTREEILAKVTGLPATGETPIWADTTRAILLIGTIIAVMVAITGSWMVIRRKQTR